MSDETIRSVTDLCISSADSSFVFGPTDPGEWRVSSITSGRIVCPGSVELSHSLAATLHEPEPLVHITLDSDGEMFHGSAVIRSLEPNIELEIVDGLVPA